MAGMCCGIVGGDSDPTAVEPTAAIGVRRRRMEVRQQQIKLITAAATDLVAITPSPEITPAKRQKLDLSCTHVLLPATAARECDNTDSSSSSSESSEAEKVGAVPSPSSDTSTETVPECEEETVNSKNCAKFGATSVRGRRREMEDAVSIVPDFCVEDSCNSTDTSDFHFYGVFDGHGCSHVATKCKARMHEIIREEMEKEMSGSVEWKGVMERSFVRMDMEVAEKANNGLSTSCCRCELRTDPQCDAGSTAVVAVVTPNKIIVSNCGDSRAVLCRNGVAVPLSEDHKPDRPDELERIESAGGKVIYWDGPRVLGVLAMSRALGDNYLKPYVIPEPEVTITERTGEEECLILASDGLWDVVTNDTAAGVARMCLRENKPFPSPPGSPSSSVVACENAESSDKACLDASLLLTRLALARHSTDNVSVVVADLRRSGGGRGRLS